MQPDDRSPDTDEAAAYPGIRERKLYELVATGGVPCSKVTGKWLFPPAEPRVRVVGAFSPENHPPILYPVSLTATARGPDAAAVLANLASPSATRNFAAEGFAIPR